VKLARLGRRSDAQRFPPGLQLRTEVADVERRPGILGRRECVLSAERHGYATAVVVRR
jgi:hypothetical protein